MNRLLPVLLLFPLFAVAAESSPGGEELVDGMEDTFWDNSNHGRFTMRTETEYWTRELDLEAWMDRPEKTLIRIHAPKKEAGSEEQNGVIVYHVRSTPKPDAPVVWSRLEFKIRDDHIPVAVTYFGERDQSVKKMTYSAIETMGGRRIPTRWTMVDSDDAKSRTVIEIESIEFNVPLEEDLFTLRRLRNPQ